MSKNRKNSTLVARATMHHLDGSQTVVEIHNDTGFEDFYRWYKRDKGRRNKTFIRKSNRNEAPNLQGIADRLQQHFESMIKHEGRQMSLRTPMLKGQTYKGRQVVDTKIIIFKKRLYVRLLECSTDKLPGYKPAKSSRQWGSWIPTGINAQKGPQRGYTTLQRKMDILTGKA